MIWLLLALIGFGPEILVPSNLPTRPSEPVMHASFVAHDSGRNAPLVDASVMVTNSPTSIPSPTLTTINGCYAVPITPNTPTGVAGCEVWGEGIASHYGPGFGVAMNFCTWVLRHEQGCGSVNITSRDTGRSIVVPVVDYCDCYTGTDNQRVVDLLYDVVVALGLDLSRGLYPVAVER